MRESMKNFSKKGARPAAVLAALLFVACSGGGGAPAGDAAGAQVDAQGRASAPAPSPSAQTLQPAASEKVYRGSIAGRGIELRLARDGERLTGSYNYDGNAASLRLEGRAGADGKFTLAEFDAGNKQTGKFACEPGGDDSTTLDIDLGCEWSKPDGSGQTYASLTEQHAAFTRGWRVAPKKIENRKYAARVSYPQLVGGAAAAVTPAAAGFNRRVSELAGKVFKEFTGEQHVEHMYLEINYDVLLATDDLVSVELAEDNNYGGAHPNSNYYAVTYDLRAGRELKLSDLFKPGSDYEKALRLHAFKEINRRAADMQKENARIPGGEVREGDELMPADREEPISAWAMTPRGLLIYFDFPHVIAAFDRNFVPYAAVKDLLRADGPGAAFAGRGD